MIYHGKYLLITDYDHLTNKRCSVKTLNKCARNNWCINDGDCASCHIAESYEETPQ